jgi:S1-C subfamily serine protease
MRPSSRWCEWWLRMGRIGLMGLCLAVWLAALAPAWTEPQPDAAVQERLKELRQVQERVQAVVKKVTPAVVAVLANPGQGSGVVVTPDGYVLTAGARIGQAQPRGNRCLSRRQASTGQDSRYASADGQRPD